MRTRMIVAAGLLATGLVLTACGPDGGGNGTRGSSLAQTILPPQPTMVPALCHEVNGRADHTCTPGLFAHSPEVLADAPKYLHTLCQPAGSVPDPKDRWIAKRRPPKNVTDKWKIQVMNAYGFRNIALKDVEGDHVGPLELDGDPGYALGPVRLPANFYPQIRHGHPLADADAKDREEGLLHDQVCSGALSLEQAQAKIINDWVR